LEAFVVPSDLDHVTRVGDVGYLRYAVAEKRRHRRQWRYYETPAGNKPVKKFIDGLSDADAAEVFAGMRDVANVGLSVARA